MSCRNEDVNLCLCGVCPARPSAPGAPQKSAVCICDVATGDVPAALCEMMWWRWPLASSLSVRSTFQMCCQIPDQQKWLQRKPECGDRQSAAVVLLSLLLLLLLLLSVVVVVLLLLLLLLLILISEEQQHQSLDNILILSSIFK